MPDFRVEGQSVSFWLRVKPRATRERLTLDNSGELRLELHAPATEGQANDACVRFLAGALRVPQGSIAIVSGHKARRKLLRIAGPTAADTIAKIERTVARNE